MFSFLLPKEHSFFDLFDQQAEHAIRAAAHFKEIVQMKKLDESMFQLMRDIEHEGDNATHEIISRLNKTFITPFDREDIHALAKELDDIVDMIHSIVNRIRVYRLEGVNPHLVEFANVIHQSALAVAQAVNGMRNMKKSKVVMDACVEVNRLENVGDSMRDKILGDLFDDPKSDPISVIKWKEVYQDAETVLDICEDVAHIVESILVKQA